MITVGVDIGQSQDPTAVLVIETDLASKAHTVRHIETMPLGTSYPLVIDRLVDVDTVCRAEGATEMLIDATGVGKPVVDLLRTRLKGGVHAVVLGGGNTVSAAAPYATVVPKRDIVAALEICLQTQRLVVLKQQGARDLRKELKAFSFALSRSTGHDSYEASAGFHDDLVIALGLALWSAELWIGRGGRRPGVRLKFYGRSSGLPGPGTIVGTAVTSTSGERPGGWSR